MSSSNSSNNDFLHNIIIRIYRFGNPVIYIIGNIGIFFSALIFSKKSWRKHVCVFYFKVCLFLNFVYLNSTVLPMSFIIGHNINILNSNTWLCKILFYTVLVCSMLSPTVLVLASIDRLLISSQNVDTRLYSSKRLAHFSISISSIFWILFNIHTLIKVNVQEMFPTVFVCYWDLSERYLNFVYYSLMIFNCLFCFLMIILSILSFKNVHHLRSIPNEQRDRVHSMTKKDFQLLRCLFIHGIIYLIFSIPPNSYTVYTMTTKSKEDLLSDFVNDLFTFWYSIFHTSSFFIFIRVSKTFRHEFKRMIYKRFGQHLAPLREENVAIINTNIMISDRKVTST
ncbi:hypothetical protein I4U23_020157 [Adineta vaga]|nr:hypothetical protein I4U23_020157 [Adineta vaga]